MVKEKLNAEGVFALTEHPVGRICPFGLAEPLPVYLDASHKAYDEVLPAAGSMNSAVGISIELHGKVMRGEWVDVC